MSIWGINFSSGEITLISLIGAISSCVFGFYLGLKQAAANRRALAAAVFREAVISASATLPKRPKTSFFDSAPQTDYSSLTLSIWVEPVARLTHGLGIAFEIYRHYIPRWRWWQRRKLDKAWKAVLEHCERNFKNDANVGKTAEKDADPKLKLKKLLTKLQDAAPP